MARPSSTARPASSIGRGKRRPRRQNGAGVGARRPQRRDARRERPPRRPRTGSQAQRQLAPRRLALDPPPHLAAEGLPIERRGLGHLGLARERKPRRAPPPPAPRTPRKPPRAVGTPRPPSPRARPGASRPSQCLDIVLTPPPPSISFRRFPRAWNRFAFTVPTVEPEDPAPPPRASGRGRSSGSSVARCFSGSRLTAFRTTRACSSLSSAAMAPAPRVGQRFRQLLRLRLPRRPEVEARVHRDPVEPGRERAVAAEAADRPVGLQEHLLGHVVRVVVVVHVAIAEPVDVALVALDQTVEGLALAALAGLDGLALALPQPCEGRCRPSRRAEPGGTPGSRWSPWRPLSHRASGPVNGPIDARRPPRRLRVTGDVRLIESPPVPWTGAAGQG